MKSISDLPTAGAPSVPSRGLIPTASCTPARVRLYQPTQRPVELREAGWQTTAWGRCRVSGRLGQRHADLLEAVLHGAERVQRGADGGLFLLVDPARVRRTISACGYSGARMRILLCEIMAAVVEIETDTMRGMGHLIDEVAEAKTRRPNPLRSIGNARERGMMLVKIGAIGTMLIEHDLRLWYDPAPIAALRSGVSQAVARHVLTHAAAPRGGWRLDGLLEAVGIDGGSQAVRDARRAIRHDADRLALLGICIGDDDRVRRVVHRPGTAAQEAASVEHRPDGVEHRPDGVEHRPDFRPLYQDYQPFKADQARPVTGRARAGAA